MFSRKYDEPEVEARHNLGPWTAYLALACAVAAALFAYSARDKAGQANTTAEAAGPPCVDAMPKVKGVQPSRGCGRIFDLLTNYCAQHRDFCLQSQRRAVKRAQETSADQHIGPIAQVRKGGDSSPGNPNNPRSPNQPSPNPPGGGGGQGGQPNNPPGNGNGQPPTTTPETPPQAQPPPEEAKKPIIDLPSLLEQAEPACQVIQPVLGPVITICPPPGG